MTHTTLKVALCTGGTGGHIFPAEALAEVLLQRGHEILVITDNRFDERYQGNLASVPVHSLPLSVPSGGILARAASLFSIAKGVMSAGSFLYDMRPDVVVGFGGYPSFPGMFAATNRKFPTILHEQNAVLGRVNKFLSNLVTAIATSFDQVHGLPESARSKVVVTGNPVRKVFSEIGTGPYSPPDGEGTIRLLITGGSLGASVFGEVVPDAIAQLPKGLIDRLHIVQQCRKDDEAAVVKRYERLGIPAKVAPFFQNLPEHMEQAHLVICRAGASTVAELATAGKPSILVPYPHAKDDHQTTNAKALADAGGGWILQQHLFTAENVAHRLQNLLQDPGQLAEAAKAAKQTAKTDAARKLADLVEDAITLHKQQSLQKEEG